MIHVAPGIFLRFEPAAETLPLFVDVSKSGLEYPKEFRSPVAFTAVHDNASMHVEDLFADAPRYGATMLRCVFAAFFIDINRHELDLDPAAIDGEWPVPLKPHVRTLKGLGLIKTKSRYGEALQERKLTVAEVEERLANYYRPYHAEMKRIVDELHARFGVLRQISGHCMSAVGAPTHIDAGKPRADFCISDLGGVTSSREFVDLLVETLRGYGYSVAINDPYFGNELIRRYGDPARGIDSIHFEVNKKLYMDIKTFRKTAGFARIKSDINRLLQVIADDTRKRIRK
ncbi:MAG: N-formylglutamate amidohydrolase [Betaproteobacteria bacterium]|nr:N-formylglutamate amidohydrolase [Betaproteobacteria bacterium]